MGWYCQSVSQKKRRAPAPLDGAHTGPASSMAGTPPSTGLTVQALGTASRRRCRPVTGSSTPIPAASRKAMRPLPADTSEGAPLVAGAGLGAATAAGPARAKTQAATAAVAAARTRAWRGKRPIRRFGMAGTDQLVVGSETGDSASGTILGTLTNLEAAAPEFEIRSTS